MHSAALILWHTTQQATGVGLVQPIVGLVQPIRLWDWCNRFCGTGAHAAQQSQPRAIAPPLLAIAHLLRQRIRRVAHAKHAVCTLLVNGARFLVLAAKHQGQGGPAVWQMHHIRYKPAFTAAQLGCGHHMIDVVNTQLIVDGDLCGCTCMFSLRLCWR